MTRRSAFKAPLSVPCVIFFQGADSLPELPTDIEDIDRFLQCVKAEALPAVYSLSWLWLLSLSFDGEGNIFGFGSGRC